MSVRANLTAHWVQNLLGAQMVGFFNTTWGSAEAAACDSPGNPSVATRSESNLRAVEVLHVIRNTRRELRPDSQSHRLDW